MKKCSKCNKLKKKTSFYKASRHALGLSAWCKTCVLNYNRKNKDRKNLRLKLWRDKNRQHVREQDRVYRANPTYKLKKRKRAKLWQKAYRKKNESFRLAQNMRSRLRNALRASNAKKKSTTVSLLGCSISEFKTYLESKFKKGMTWKNYGTKWHVDHIVPLSTVDLTKTSNLKRVCHFTNLQPLFVKDNLQKGNRYVG